MKNLTLTILAVVVFALHTLSQSTGDQCQYYPNNGDLGAITSGPASFIPAIIGHYSDSTDTAWITIFPVENSPAPRSGIKQGAQPSGTPYFIYQQQILPSEQITITAGPGILISGTYPNFIVSLEVNIPGETPGDIVSVIKTIYFTTSGEELQTLPSEPGIFIRVTFFSDGSTLTSKILQ